MPKEITPKFREHLKRIGFKKGKDKRRHHGVRFQKGHKINVGKKRKPFSETTKKKLSESHKGQSAWNKGKAKVKECKNCNKKFIGQNKIFCSDLCRFNYSKGKNSPSWKGGITNINSQIRKSEEYKLWRKSVFERDDYTCIWCGKVGGILHADHIKPFSLFPELRFAIDNGRTLCIDCHKKTNTYLTTKGLRWNWNK